MVSGDGVDILLRRFRRQLLKIRFARLAVIIFVIGTLTALTILPARFSDTTLILIVGAAVILWFLLLGSGVMLAQSLQNAQFLIATGQLDEAELWLNRIINGVALSPGAHYAACQEMAVIAARRDRHEDVVRICSELLRHPLRASSSLETAGRLLLADNLLTLSRISEAYTALEPVYRRPLSLLERMRLLPIQLRYELAADHSGSAAAHLPEKVQIAELLDGSQAALVHALLAEACRREARTTEYRFLAERAWLYGDLTELVEHHSAIEPIAQLTPRTDKGRPPAP